MYFPILSLFLLHFENFVSIICSLSAARITSGIIHFYLEVAVTYIIPVFNLKNTMFCSNLPQPSLQSRSPPWPATVDNLSTLVFVTGPLSVCLDFCHCLLLCPCLFLCLCLSLCSISLLSHLFLTVFLSSACFLCTLVFHSKFLYRSASLSFLGLCEGGFSPRNLFLRFCHNVSN